MRPLLGYRTMAGTVAALALAVTVAPSAAARGGAHRETGPATGFATGPATIPLPDGFRPEGIAIGSGPYAYFGSLADGRIYRADLRTGAGSEISPPVGTPSVGMKVDRRGRLFVAGGAAGDARVIDVRTGAVLARHRFAEAPTFVNDVALVGDGAYFTDSRRAVIYRLPLGASKRPPSGFETIPLTGDFTLHPDPAAFNLNGITAAPDGRGLLAVQSSTGLLFRIDPATGATRKVDVPGATFVNGDGLLLAGRTCFVVRNRDNLVVAVALNRSGTRGTVRAEVTDPRFDVPTTVAAFGGRLYLPNARFTTAPTPATPYTAVAIPKP